MINQNKSIALVIGLCSHGLAMTRALAKGGIEVHAFEANTNLPGAVTNSATVHQVKSIKTDSLLNDLEQFRNAQADDVNIVLFPTNDNNVRVVANNIEQISKHYIVSWHHCADLILQLLSKDNIEARCEAVNLHYPQSFIIHSLADIEHVQKTFEFPVIIKPVKPQSSFKALKCQSPEQLIVLIKQYQRDLPIIVQTWIEGTDEDLHFGALYLKRGQIITSYLGRKLESYPPAMGQTTVAVSSNNQEVLTLTKRFFADLDISGPVSLELKKDNQGRYWVIEPTIGRSDFWVGLCVQSGCNLPLIEFNASLKLPISIPAQQAAIWFDSERDIFAFPRHIAKCKPINVINGLSTSFSYLWLKDPAPFFRASKQALQRISQKLIRPKASTSNEKADEYTIQCYNSISSLPKECINFIERNKAKNFFLSLDWYKNFCQQVATANVYFYCLYNKDNAIVAMLPTWLKDQKILGINYRTISSLTNYYSPIFDIFVNQKQISLADAYSRFFAFFNANKHEWDIVDFSPLTEEIQNVIYNAACQNQLPCFSYFKTLNLFESDIKSYDHYIDQRDSKLKNTLKRKEKKLTKEFDWYISLTTDENIEQALNLYHQVYNASWKETEPYPNFINGMAHIAAADNKLRLGLLCVNNKPIAAQLWLVEEDTAYIYKLAYNSNYKTYSPGTILTDFMFKRVINHDNVTKVDFLTGDDAYKSDWMSERRSLYGIQVVNRNSAKGQLLYFFDYISKQRKNLFNIQ